MNSLNISFDHGDIQQGGEQPIGIALHMHQLPGVRLVILYFLLVYPLVSHAELTLSEKMPSQSLVAHAEYLEDVTHKLAFEQIQQADIQSLFQTLTSKDINRGITRSVFWLKFQIKNPSSSAIDWVIYPETSYLDSMELFVHIEGTGWQHHVVSDYFKFNQRDLAYRKLNASYELPAGKAADVFIKLSNNTLETTNIQLFVSEKTQFINYVSKEYLSYGIYYGLFIGLALLTLCVWYFSQSHTYLTFFYFFVYILSNLLMWSSLNGFSFQFFWPNSPWLYNQSFHIIFLCVALFSLLFSRQFLNTRHHLPRIDKALLVLVGIYFIAIICRIAGIYDLVLYVSFFSLLAMCIHPILGWYCYKKGNRYLLFYTIAWIPYSLSLIASIISASSQWSYFAMDSLYLSQCAVLFECTLLMIATLGKQKDRSENLSQLSLLDPLTQLGNRRCLESHIKDLRKDPDKEGEYWLLLLDIDHFKHINDTHGHAFGDEVLIKLAQILKAECRSVDVAIRWGGEEFILLIHVNNDQMAYMIAERIRKTFLSLSNQSGSKPMKHTLSIGMHQVNFDCEDVLFECVDLADKALYRAKSSGRNKVMVYSKELEFLQI